MTVEKLHDRGVGLDAVLPLREAVALVLEDHLLDRDTPLVDRVGDGRDLDPAAIQETEARIYLGEEALERGLVDELGRREDIEADLEDELGEPVTVEEFEPERGIADRIQMGGARLAYAFGAGIASVVGADRTPRFEL